MLLACARKHLERISFFTIAIPHSGGRLDCHVAPRLARRFRLDHSVVPYRSPSPADLELLHYRTGACVDGFHARMNATYGQLEPQRVVLIGAAGELGRSFHWRKGDTESTPVSAADLLTRLVKLLHPLDLPKIERRAQQWLDSLPLTNTLTIWGLLLNEQLNGCWFGPLLYGLASNRSYVFPFSHRRLMECMLTLPTPYRRQNSLENDLIGGEWPELLRFPFNWPLGVRKYLHFVRRRLRLLARLL